MRRKVLDIFDTLQKLFEWDDVVATRDALLDGLKQLPVAVNGALEGVDHALRTVARSGETEAEFIARLMPAAQRAAAGYDYLNEAYAAVPTMPDPAEERDTKFANGLEVILDGLALRLPT